jgi:alkanesulfonate monooxygenase
MKVSDSSWRHTLSQLADQKTRSDTYWLGPFEHSKSNCPYLVGDYEAVAHELAQYIALGYTTFILDIPPVEEELEHTAMAFAAAQRLLGSLEKAE